MSMALMLRAIVNQYEEMVEMEEREAKVKLKVDQEEMVDQTDMGNLAKLDRLTEMLVGMGESVEVMMKL